VKRTPVDSAALLSVGYDSQSQVLEVEFAAGSLYQYFDVPEAVYLAMLDSGSKGRFFAEHIKERYNFREI
jgi:hypothetical protein